MVDVLLMAVSPDGNIEANLSVDWRAVPRVGDHIAVPGDHVQVERVTWHMSGGITVELEAMPEADMDRLQDDGWEVYKSGQPRTVQ